MNIFAHRIIKHISAKLIFLNWQVFPREYHQCTFPASITVSQSAYPYIM